jgi:hypothetical protein
MKKQPFVLQNALLRLIFCCYYTDRVTKTQRICTEGFSFADKFLGTDPTYAAQVMHITVLQCSR